MNSINSEDFKDMNVHFNEPLKAVCVDPDTTSKRERSFVVGTL
jgi:hypothetical protein